MYSSLLLPALGAAFALAQGEGAGYPPPPPQTLSTAMSGVLPVIPTETPFQGGETEEGALVYDGPTNPTFQPVNGPATTAAGLPAATYQAILPSTNFDNGTGSTVTGDITISSSTDGTGVSVSVNFTGFPSESEYGPFVYHIHQLPVPANGNCSATLGHLDPTDRGELYPCNVAAPATCQVGDLAGKHGNITVPSFVAQYTDDFLSCDPSSAAFFGSLSVVVHTSNATRITCANFQQVSSSGASNGTATNGTTSPTPTQSTTPYTDAANKLAGFGTAGLAAAVAFLL